MQNVTPDLLNMQVVNMKENAIVAIQVTINMAHVPTVILVTQKMLEVGGIVFTMCLILEAHNLLRISQLLHHLLQDQLTVDINI